MMISKTKFILMKTPNTDLFDEKQELTFVHGVGNALKNAAHLLALYRPRRCRMHCVKQVNARRFLI